MTSLAAAGNAGPTDGEGAAVARWLPTALQRWPHARRRKRRWQQRHPPAERGLHRRQAQHLAWWREESRVQGV